MSEPVETYTGFTANGFRFSKSRGDLICILELLSIRVIGLEVGTLAGVSADLLAPWFDAYYCVDAYEPDYDPNDDASDARRMAAGRLVFERIVRPRHPNLTLVEIKSPLAAARFEDGMFDLVYLDACHLYEAVKTDIRAWRPKLRPGGVLAGHDFTPSFPGVQRAVRELLGEPRYYSGGHWAVVVQPTS